MTCQASHALKIQHLASSVQMGTASLGLTRITLRSKLKNAQAERLEHQQQCAAWHMCHTAAGKPWRLSLPMLRSVSRLC